MIPDRLAGVEWLERPEVQEIFRVLDGDEGRTRAVGGIVRDSLIGRERANTDIDMATELLPVAVMQRAKAAGIATYPTGIEHGTVTLKQNDTVVEVTTLRRDVTTDGRHAEVAFGTDWVADAKRRDFTLNALYCFADGRLFDPLGGAGDLLAGRVRFIGDAAERIREDGLRVFRFFRFSASHGGQALDPDGLAACRVAVGNLGHLSRERIGSEMLRMLSLPHIAQTVAVMAGIGLLNLNDSSLRALARYEALGGNGAETRIALIAGDDLEDVRDDWRLSRTITDRVQAITRAGALIVGGKIGEAAYRFGEAAVEGLAMAASLEDWERERLMEAARELSRLHVAPMPVSGKDLLARGMLTGPELGETLARLERAWIDSEFSLSAEDLLAKI